MKRLVSFLLLLAIIVSASFALFSCAEKPEMPIGPPGDLVPNEDGDEGNETGGGGESIITPNHKEYGRRTVKFDEMTYARPDTEALIAQLEAVTELIEKNEVSFEEQIEAIIASEPAYESFISMYSYSNIMASKDSSSSYWCGEFDFIATEAPSVSAAVEKMYVAAACSEHSELFESEYFGEGLVEEYAGGGIYTDELVALFEKESKLENKYNSLSTANVKITYEKATDTVDSILDFYLEYYGEDSVTYNRAYEECMLLYTDAYNKITRELLVKLVKVRREIANELELESYTDYAYDTIYHDYTSEDMLAYITDVAKYVVPVYIKLNYYVFGPHLYTYTGGDEVSREKIFNTLYSVYSEMGEDVDDIYSYMLQYELYDFMPATANRRDGAYCTYINSYDAPFIFISSSGTVDDFATLAHEFGHFADAFINFNANTSLDLSEVSSLGLEYLTTLKLEDKLTREDHKYLTYMQLNDAFLTLIYQSFYALFEHYAYALGLDEINEENLVLAMQEAADTIGLNSEFFTSLDSVLIPHIILYPHYVESYVTSTAVALEIYYTEKQKDGAGVEIYLNLIERGEDEGTFTEELVAVGISSPFEKGYLKNLAEYVHYDILGTHYFTDAENDNAA